MRHLLATLALLLLVAAAAEHRYDLGGGSMTSPVELDVTDYSDDGKLMALLMHRFGGADLDLLMVEAESHPDADGVEDALRSAMFGTPVDRFEPREIRDGEVVGVIYVMPDAGGEGPRVQLFLAKPDLEWGFVAASVALPQRRLGEVGGEAGLLAMFKSLRSGG